MEPLSREEQMEEDSRYLAAARGSVTDGEYMRGSFVGPCAAFFRDLLHWVEVRNLPLTKKQREFVHSYCKDHGVKVPAGKPRADGGEFLLHMDKPMSPPGRKPR